MRFAFHIKQTGSRPNHIKQDWCNWWGLLLISNLEIDTQAKTCVVLAEPIKMIWEFIAAGLSDWYDSLSQTKAIIPKLKLKMKTKNVFKIEISIMGIFKF